MKSRKKINAICVSYGKTSTNISRARTHQYTLQKDRKKEITWCIIIIYRRVLKSRPPGNRLFVPEFIILRDDNICHISVGIRSYTRREFQSSQHIYNLQSLSYTIYRLGIFENSENAHIVDCLIFYKYIRLCPAKTQFQFVF